MFVQVTIAGSGVLPSTDKSLTANEVKNPEGASA